MGLFMAYGLRISESLFLREAGSSSSEVPMALQGMLPEACFDDVALVLQIRFAHAAYYTMSSILCSFLESLDRFVCVHSFIPLTVPLTAMRSPFKRSATEEGTA